MKIQLITPPSHLNHEYATKRQPLGLAYIASFLIQNNYDVVITDSEALRLDLKQIEAEIKKQNADVIGITTFTPTADLVGEIIKIIKRTTNSIILAGGSHPTALPGEMLTKYPNIDFIILGEGELTILELLNKIKNNERTDDIKGIAYLKNGQVKINAPREPIQNLDELPFPARDLLPLDMYRPTFPEVTHGRYADISSARGCPYRCVFCDRTIFGQVVRARSADNILDEIELLVKKYNVTQLGFFDDTFTYDKKRATDICDGIIKRKLNFVWDCTSRVNAVDKQLLKKMADAGCTRICFGIESGNQEVLNYMRKGITLEQSRNAVKWAKDAGISTHLYFIIGFPIEKREHIEQTVAFAKELDGDSAQFNVLTAFPGSDITEIARKENLLIETDWSKQFTKIPSMRTKYLSVKELEELRAWSFTELSRGRCRRHAKKYLTHPLLFLKKAKKVLREPELALRFMKGIISGK